MEKGAELRIEHAVATRDQAYYDLAAAVSGPLAGRFPDLETHQDHWWVTLPGSILVEKQPCDFGEFYQTSSSEGRIGILCREDSVRVFHFDRDGIPGRPAEPETAMRLANRIWHAT